jgi:hypothetical protein
MLAQPSACTIIEEIVTGCDDEAVHCEDEFASSAARYKQ